MRIALVLLLLCAVAGAAPLPAASAATDPGWRPDVAAARAYAAGRRGTIAFSVRTPTRAWGLRSRRAYPAASVLKAMLMLAYLDRPGVRRRELRRSDRALLAPMIRRSDDATATRIVGIVGAEGLRRVARRAGMRRFRPVLSPWGHSRIDADDQTRLFLDVERLLPDRHRAYAMRLLETVVPSQRWGIARVQPPGWRLWFKGGWGSGAGLVDHQVALLGRGEQRVSVAVLTYGNGSHAYGKETLRGMAKRLLRGLSAAGAVP